MRNLIYDTKIGDNKLASYQKTGFHYTVFSIKTPKKQTNCNKKGIYYVILLHGFLSYQ